MDDVNRKRTLSTVAIPAALAGLALAGACASTSEEPRRTVPGCYYFAQDSVFRELRLPWGVRLEETLLQGWPGLEARGARKATTLTGTEEVDYPFGYWISTAPDSVKIGYPAGGGLVLDLAIREDRGLAGTARPVGDVLRPGDPAPRTRPVELMWARCPGD
jgi:hypothetical protein